MGLAKTKPTLPPDSNNPTPVSMTPGCFITPIAENDDVIVYSTNFSVQADKLNDELKKKKKKKKPKDKKKNKVGIVR